MSYKLGSIYSVITALLLSTQEPLSFLAAKRLSVTVRVLDPSRSAHVDSAVDLRAEQVAAT